SSDAKTTSDRFLAALAVPGYCARAELPFEADPPRLALRAGRQLDAGGALHVRAAALQRRQGLHGGVAARDRAEHLRRLPRGAREEPARVRGAGEGAARE